MSRTNTRRFLLATASLLVASVSQPSFAQVASTPDQQPSPAVAKAANPQEDAIGDIVVTATKRLGQTNQRTPIAVTAIDAAGLENAHVQSISELTKMVPNVNLNSSVAVPGINNFSIRGMGIYSTIPSSTPTVGIFIDGIYVGANAGSALQNAFDLDGLEVLRGPQGLLFGRNVTAGAILIRTSEPTDHLKIGAQLGVESGPDVTGSVVVSGPLTDDGKLSAKIAAFYNKDFGYFTNLYNGNRHFGKSATSTVRGALAYRPDDSFRNGAKINSVRANAAFVQEIAKEHGSFGKFLAAWPSSDEIGLLNLLAKRGSRLGGNTGQMFLRFVGWDGFVTSQDVVRCLRDAGLDIAEELKSKSDLAMVQTQFNAWAEETGLPYVHLSRICAMSIGENDTPK